jgi:outer membrane protein assembly factor BamE (lipoprotein component of BamABCDE complex)
MSLFLPQKTYLTLTILSIFTSGCAYQAPLATIPARQIETQKITLGSVQSSVKKGASSSDVINALGSPNIVTSNQDGSEMWVYDKIVTEAEMASGQNTAVTTRSTRTMIVTIKFDKSQRVDTVSYRQTSY